MKGLSILMDKITRNTVLVLFAISVFFLTTVSIFGSCFLNHDEYTFFVSDNGVVHVVVWIFFIIACLIGRKYLKGKISDNAKKVICFVVLAIYAITLIVLSVYVALEPRADQKSVVDTALAMIQGDYSAYQPGGYMYVYPNQIGIVYLFYYLFQIFPFGIKTVCVLNAISALVTVIGMNGIGKVINKSFGDRFLTGIVTIGFWPMAFYTTFIYGNLIGMALSTVGIWCTLKFFSDRNNIYIIIAVLTSALAVIVKQNFIIPLVGIVIFLVLDMIKKPNKKTFIFFVSVLIATLGISSVINIHVESITGKKISKGVPALAWVVMGMQEGYMAYGWHNQYNEDVFRNNNCDTDSTNEIVIRDFKERIEEFVKKPSYAMKFYFQKTISQWNNPTFECFWINDLSKRSSDGIMVKKLPEWLGNLAGEPGSKVLIWYCNAYQSLILIGVCLWLIWSHKKIVTEQLLPATIFLGGFVFHLFWEAKCQYVIPYFILLFPYAVCGFQLFLQQIEHIVENRKNEKVLVACKKNRKMVGIVLGMVIVVFVSTVGHGIVKKVFGFSESAYDTFLESE